MNCCRIPRQKVVLILARWMKTLLTGIVLALAFLSFPAFSKYVQADEKRTGRHIMNDVFKRHEMFPYYRHSSAERLKQSLLVDPVWC